MKYYYCGYCKKIHENSKWTKLHTYSDSIVNLYICNICNTGYDPKTIVELMKSEVGENELRQKKSS